MAQPLIIIIGAEITFLDDNKTKEYDIVKLHDSGHWVYTKTGNIERWFPVVRIHEIRRDIVRSQ